MAANLKAYTYLKGKDTALDEAFSAAVSYEKVKLGKDVLFWKSGLRWFAVPIERVQRAYRQVELVQGRLCCGRASFDIHRLILVLTDGTELAIHIGDNEIGDQVKKKAENLFRSLKDTHPELQYGKA